jgi:hypothetical protein
MDSGLNRRWRGRLKPAPSAVRINGENRSPRLKRGFKMPNPALLPPATFFLSALLFLGCAPTAEDKLVGRWKGGLEIDDASVQQELASAGSNPIQKALVEKFIQAIESGTIDVELKADGSYTSTVRLGPLSKDAYGQWEVVRETGDQATIRMTDHNGQAQEPTVRFEEDGTLAIDAPDAAKGLAVFRCKRVP